MKATWEMEFDEQMLELMAFSVGVMRDMLHEEVTIHSKRKRGPDQRSLAQLRKDVKTADSILAAVYKGQVNVAVAEEVLRKTDIRRKAASPAQRHGKKRRDTK